MIVIIRENNWESFAKKKIRWEHIYEHFKIDTKYKKKLLWLLYLWSWLELNKEKIIIVFREKMVFWQDMIIICLNIDVEI